MHAVKDGSSAFFLRPDDVGLRLETPNGHAPRLKEVFVYGTVIGPSAGGRNR